MLWVVHAKWLSLGLSHGLVMVVNGAWPCHGSVIVDPFVGELGSQVIFFCGPK